MPDTTKDTGDFQLSASLAGHDKDVRAVCFPVPGVVFTSSRDCTVQVWRESSDPSQTYSPTLLTQGPYSFNSLAYLPPSDSRPQYPNGLVLAGSQGHTIEVLHPDADISETRVTLLSGHSSNVSALDVFPNGDFVISGDWDGRAKLWNTKTWEIEADLMGTDPGDKHRAIWTVLAYSNTIVFTGSADHVIRGYSLQNAKPPREMQPGLLIRTPDVVRALCQVRKNAAGAKIASAGNDFMIRLWKFNGALVGALRGHESFIYALDCLPTGELVSSSEDRTVRVWNGESCIQTISHPALSIWSVSVCQQTGDFSTGASDNVARIFSRSRDRIASPRLLQEFSESVQHSSIPQQQVGDVNPNSLPGLEFIETKSGTKDGQTVMINSGGGNISVYQWSVGQNQWLLVGTVVDSSSAADSGDMSGSVPPTATPQGGLGSIDMTGSGPKSSGNIISPLGQRAVFATLLQSNFTPILNRIATVNSSLSELDGTSSGSTLGPEQFELLNSLVKILEKEVPKVQSAIPACVPATSETFSLEPASIALVLKVATTWSYKDRLPGLDLLRCMAASPSLSTFTDHGNHNVLDILLPGIIAFPKDPETKLAVDLKSAENNAMMILRLITNLFITGSGQRLVIKHSEVVVTFLSAVLDLSGSKNRSLLVALTSAASNITSFALREQEASGQHSFTRDSMIQVIQILGVPIMSLAGSEVVYRALVALGNLASIPGEGYLQQIRSANADLWIRSAMDNVKEERVISVSKAILKLLE